MYERHGGAHMGISEKMGTILNITELNCEDRVGGG